MEELARTRFNTRFYCIGWSTTSVSHRVKELSSGAALRGFAAAAWGRGAAAARFGRFGRRRGDVREVVGDALDVLRVEVLLFSPSSNKTTELDPWSTVDRLTRDVHSEAAAVDRFLPPCASSHHQYHRFSFMARATSSGSMMDGTSPANMSPSGATVSGRRSCHRAGGTRKKKGPQHAPG